MNQKITAPLVGHALCTAVSLACAQTPPATIEAQLPEIRVTAPAATEFTVSDSPSAVGAVSRIDVERQPAAPARLDRLLVDAGLAAWDAGNSLGLASGLSLRGFTASNQGGAQLQGARAYLNGHADIAWRFARDTATVKTVEVLGGHDATLLGAGSPGGVLHYVSKAPEGETFQRLQATAASNGMVRLVGDAEVHWGPMQTRGILVLHRNDRTVEDVTDAHEVALLSNRVPLGNGGDLRLDLEYQHNAQPFPFGTAYAGGRFWFDRPFVDPRAAADRRYNRQALYLRQPLASMGEETVFSAHWQHAASSRLETLLGFLDVLNASQLRGYYRLIDERNRQSDAGIKLQGRLRLAGDWLHRWTALLQHHSQARAFAGPQSIGGFLLDVDTPVFPSNLSALTLSPRYAFEHYRERGLGLADVATYGPWDLRLGVRRSSVAVDSSLNPALPLTQVADKQHTSASLGLGYKISDRHRVWISRSESFLPNRGRQSDGDYLPPSEGLQWETGWQYRHEATQVSATLFDLRQSNLPARDPLDNNAFVLIGSNRSRGVVLSAATRVLGIDWSGSITRLRARVEDRVSATQGPYLIGAPDSYGSVKVSIPMPRAIEFWAVAQFAASRPGDDKATFRAPGYAVLNLGLNGRITASTRWAVRVDNASDRRYVRALTGSDNVWQGERRRLLLWVETSFGS